MHHASSTGSTVVAVTLKDQIVHRLRQQMIEGRFKPGQRIVESNLAAELGLGNTAVREALYHLEDQGFVTRITNKGTFVTQFSPEEIDQIFRVRCELESLAVELVRERLPALDLVGLRAHVTSMRATAETMDLDAFYRHDLEFHCGMWRLAGNPFLSSALEKVTVPLFAFFIMRNTQATGEDLCGSAGRHAAILEALLRGEDARPLLRVSLSIWRREVDLWSGSGTPR
jgi:DNA-binding GntR family transcriptional regulator